MTMPVAETSENLLHGHRAVGSTAVQIAPINRQLDRGVLLRAPGSGDPTPNTAAVFVGGQRVTADSAEGTGGLALAPGESMFIPVKFASELYAVSTVDNQDLGWMAL